MRPSNERRIAFVLGQNSVGGTEVQARSLIRGLRARGVVVDVFLVDGGAGTAGLPLDTTVLAGSRPRGLRAIRPYARMAMRLRRRLRSGRYQAVHSAMARAYFLVSVATWGLRDVRHVSWRRNVGVHLEGHGGWLLRLAERFALRRADVVVSNSEEVARYWADFDPASTARHEVVPNILESWRFEETAPALPRGDRIRVVTVGGLKPEKGHRYLVQALADTPQLRDSTELVIVGDGDLRHKLETQAAELGVAVLMAGAVTDPRPWLHSADIYVHPSLSEGSSNAVAEAMAAGLPIIATRVGGMKELVGAAGVLVEPRHPEEIARAIESLAAQPVQLTSLGNQAQARARDRSAPDRVISKYLELYGAL